MQSNAWAPGGSTGWHTHPGHSLIIVTAGAVTDYEGHDPDCKPHVYKTGMAFVDPGGDHIHIVRNEGAVEAKTIDVSLKSYGIYLAHIIVLNSVHALLAPAISNPFLRVPSIALITFVTTYCLIKILSLVPASKYIVG